MLSVDGSLKLSLLKIQPAPRESSLKRGCGRKLGLLGGGSCIRPHPPTVVVAVQRGTQVEFDQVLPRGTALALTEALRPVLGVGAVLSTDGNAAYWTVAKELNVESGAFVSAYHGKGGNGIWHVQSVNRYDASLKTWMARFHGVATKYLPNYLGWRRLLDRFKEHLTPQQFLFHALRTAYV